MNIVYYIVSSFLKDKNVGLSGGHGYSYNPANESKRKLQKDTPSIYGYFVNGNYQNIAVDQIDIYNGRILNANNETEAFLLHLERVIKEWVTSKKEDSKLLIITNCVKGHKMIAANRHPESVDAELFKRVYELYAQYKSSIIIDVEYYAKGGEGPKVAHKQLELATALCELPKSEPIVLDKMDLKEYKNPEVDFNKLVTASRWYFNTGDKSDFWDVDENGYRKYTFGRVDPDKNYYGKATPDVYYSALFTKTPIKSLDKLFTFCQNNKDNPYNIMSAGNLNFIKSKEVARIIDTIPGVYNKKDLIAPMTVGSTEDAVLVETIDPPGLSYRITDFQVKLKLIHNFFMKRDENGVFGNSKFVDITDKFFEKDAKGKWKINANFTNNTLTVPVVIDAPGCVKPVTINLSVKYDTPERNALNSLIVNKIEDIKVYVGLDFTNPSGVSYCTVVSTPDFNYIHSNSIANLRVYSLKELGK